MKISPSFILPLILAATASPLAAQQLYEFANFVTNPFVPAPTAAYLSTDKSASVSLGTLGNFTTRVSTATGWGTLDTPFPGFPAPPTGTAISASQLEPSFAGQVSNLTVVALLSSAGGSIETNFDFTTLAGGFLPAGSALAINDVDGFETSTFSTNVAGWYSLAPDYFYQAGTNLTNSWGTGQPAPTAADAPATSDSTPTDLVLKGKGTLTDSVTNIIITTMNLFNLKLTTTQGDPNAQLAQAFAVGAATQQVPEVSSSMLGVAGAAALLLRRRRIAD